jgi:hypothetical protein
MASARQTGLYGALYLHVPAAGAQPALASVRKVADVYNLEFDTSVNILPCGRIGEGFRRFVPGPGSARITGDARFQNLATMAAIADEPLESNPVGALAHPQRVAFKLVTNDGDQNATHPLSSSTVLAGDDLPIAGQQIIQGFGYFERGALNIPHDDAITQPFDIQIDGEWQFVTST